MYFARLLISCGLCVFGAGCISFQTSTSDNWDGLPILQGHTTATSTQIAVVHNKSLKPRFFVRSAKGEYKLILKEMSLYQEASEFSDAVVTHATIRGLDPRETYQFEVRDEAGHFIDRRTF